MILAGRNQRRNPCKVRSSLSQFPLRRTGLPPTGQKTPTRLSYADARLAIGIRSLVMAVAASRLTMRITIGSGFIAAAALDAERLSPFFLCSRFFTRITARWRAARHFFCALWGSVAGTRRCQSSRILIGLLAKRMDLPPRASHHEAAIQHDEAGRVAQINRGRISALSTPAKLTMIATKRHSARLGG